MSSCGSALTRDGLNDCSLFAFDTETGAKKAVKIVSKGNCADLSRLDVEVTAMLRLDHPPNIVRLDELLETPSHVYFVMDLYLGGNLADHVAIAPIPEALARHFFRQLAKAAAYCHKMGVSHRDLKLEDMLLDATGRSVKVCDFGHAGLYSGRFDMFSTGLVGSLYHLSPEQIGGAAYSGTKVDVWALGVALDRMLTSFPPFYSETPQEIVDLIMQIKWQHKGMVHPDTGVSLPIPPLVTALLETIFVDDPDKRPDADDLISSAWLTTKREDLDVPISQLPSLSNSRIPLAGWMSTRARRGRCSPRRCGASASTTCSPRTVCTRSGATTSRKTCASS